MSDAIEKLEQTTRSSEKLGRMKGLQDAFHLASAVHGAAQSKEALDTAFAICTAICRRIESVAAEQ